MCLLVYINIVYTVEANLLITIYQLMVFISDPNLYCSFKMCVFLSRAVITCGHNLLIIDLHLCLL